MTKRVAIQVAVGRRVRHLREREHLSQMALAEAADLNRVFVGKLERGETAPTVQTLEKLSKALRVQPYELLMFEEMRSNGDDLVRRFQALVGRVDARDLERLRKIIDAFFEG